MLDAKLSDDELNEIDIYYKSILDNGCNKLENDLKLLLGNGILSLKYNLFFASISVFTVFIEKYLRDILIKCEYDD